MQDTPPALDAKLQFLRASASYGEHAGPVECIETHMSWLFLVGSRVFKLKKAVCFPFLDFTTLHAREWYCREEVRLNSRMAPDVYLGVAALQWQHGAFVLIPEPELPAPGSTEDWLVCMRRLPLQQTLLQRMAEHRVTSHDMGTLSALLGRFYRSAPTVDVAGDDYLARFQRSQASSREVLLRPQFQLDHATAALDRLDAALVTGAELLRTRATGHRIVDGHGDLRPDHIFMLHPPVVIDCLEFNASLRQVDPLDELAYLALECDMAGAAWVGPQLIADVTRELQDVAHPALVHLYTAHRALLRARLAMAHLLDPTPRTPEKWLPLAQRYIAHALAAADGFTAARHRGRRE